MALVLRLLAIGAIVVLVVGGGGLVIAHGIAKAHGVEEVTIPTNTFIEKFAAAADYADAYRIPMTVNEYTSIEAVAENAFEKGEGEVYRDTKEVAYEGSAPGLEYHVSYLLDRTVTPPTLTVSTSVKTYNRKGRLYFGLMRHVHRHGVPFLVDRLAQNAPMN